MSGNGIRCFAQALAIRRGDLRRSNDPHRRRPAPCRAPGDRGPAHGAWPPSTSVRSTELTEPAGWAAIGAHPDRPVAHLGLGNPHTVVGVDDVAAVDLLALGRHVPDVNLEIVEPGPEPDAITMRVHERGAGITEACGTGACAAAWAAGAVGARQRRRHRTRRAHGRRRAESGARPARTRPRHADRPGHLRRHDRGTQTVSNPYQEALGATLIERSVRERIVLVGVTFPGSDDETTEASLDELSSLIDTAGADEVGRMVQRRDHPDHTWFIGKGKAAELHELCLAVDADTVVFDNELSPAQQYNLEKLLGRTAIDRTAVILDIFAQNAHTLEGKAQVELALLRYRLPRLRRGATAKLSQQRGGVGTRFGGGETKLEVDRRRIKRRISKLVDELERALSHPPAATPAAGPQRARRGDDRRLHQRRQVDVAQHAHRRRRAVRGPPVRHARPDDPAPVAPRRRAGAGHRHRRLRAPSAARAGRVVQEHAGGRQPGRLPGPRRRRRAPPTPRGRSTPCARCSPRSAPPPCPSCSCSTRPTWRPSRPSDSSATTPGRWPSAPPRARASTTSCGVLARPAALDQHGRRAGRAVRARRRPGGDPPRGRGRLDDRRAGSDPRSAARLSDASAGRLAEFVVAPGRT